MSTRRGLTLTQWFSKQGLTAEEIKTVDAILDYISLSGGPKGNPEAAARFAERSLDILSLDSLGLTDVGPILELKSLSHMTLTGNSFSQSQIEALITGLPNLRIIVVDANIQCRTDLNPKVKCLK
jgi:Leucine-rich repeat (LRR) protein